MSGLCDKHWGACEGVLVFVMVCRVRVCLCGGVCEGVPVRVCSVRVCL